MVWGWRSRNTAPPAIWTTALRRPTPPCGASWPGRTAPPFISPSTSSARRLSIPEPAGWPGNVTGRGSRWPAPMESTGWWSTQAISRWSTIKPGLPSVPWSSGRNSSGRFRRMHCFVWKTSWRMSPAFCSKSSAVWTIRGLDCAWMWGTPTPAPQTFLYPSGSPAAPLICPMCTSTTMRGTGTCTLRWGREPSTWRNV